MDVRWVGFHPPHKTRLKSLLGTNSVAFYKQLIKYRPKQFYNVGPKAYTLLICPIRKLRPQKGFKTFAFTKFMNILRHYLVLLKAYHCYGLKHVTGLE